MQADLYRLPKLPPIPDKAGDAAGLPSPKIQPGHALADEADNLIGNRSDSICHLLNRQRAAAIRPEDGGHIPGLHALDRGNIQHELIHADSAYHRDAPRPESARW